MCWFFYFLFFIFFLKQPACYLSLAAVLGLSVGIRSFVISLKACLKQMVVVLSCVAIDGWDRVGKYTIVYLL